MSRTARLVLPGHPHHVVHRGHNKQDIFTGAQDYAAYLATLHQFRHAYGVKLHAYCLMTNHVHLLLTPARPTGIAQLMKRVAGRYTRYYNKLAQRSGTLWGGRYRSSLIDSESYLLACCRYIELNPVRAGLVADPRQYSWSSCRHRFAEGGEKEFDADPCYLAMGKTHAERQAGYAAFLMAGELREQRAVIREALARGQPTADSSRSNDLAVMLGRPIVQRGPGRPKKK